MKTKLCAACGKFFFWGLTERGRFVALDEDPNPKGDWVRMTTATPPGVARVDALSPADLMTFRERYTSHTTTCTGRRR